MFNVKVFADFIAPAAASQQDRQLLETMQSVRKSTDAGFVNFSVFDYRNDSPDVLHFLTYPMDWISHYVRNYFIGTDPFQTVDFRRASHVDWRDIYADGAAAGIWCSFTGQGLGNNALSVPIHHQGETYGVMSLVFRTSDNVWAEHKRRNMEMFRFEADRLAGRYQALHAQNKPQSFHLTSRETQVLRHVALGKTDDQIAEKIGIGKWTVVGHLQSAKYKLGCSNRTSAVAFAITAGLIDLKNAG